MVYRAGLYHWRFALGMEPFNYYDGADDHIRQVLERLTDSFDRLVENVDLNRARRIDAKVRKVERVAVHHGR